jgi:hypothetical protein
LMWILLKKQKWQPGKYYPMGFKDLSQHDQSDKYMVKTI